MTIHKSRKSKVRPIARPPPTFSFQNFFATDKIGHLRLLYILLNLCSIKYFHIKVRLTGHLLLYSKAQSYKQKLEPKFGNDQAMEHISKMR